MNEPCWRLIYDNKGRKKGTLNTCYEIKYLQNFSMQYLFSDSEGMSPVCFPYGLRRRPLGFLLDMMKRLFLRRFLTGLS